MQQGPRMPETGSWSPPTGSTPPPITRVGVILDVAITTGQTNEGDMIESQVHEVGRPDIHAENLAAAVAFDADCDDYRDRTMRTFCRTYT